LHSRQYLNCLYANCRKTCRPIDEKASRMTQRQRRDRQQEYIKSHFQANQKTPSA
jgi:hypothetical protein